LKRHREGGFNGLFDGDRGTFGSSRALTEELLQAAMTLRKQESSLSIPQILDLLRHCEGIPPAVVDRISKATLSRQLSKRGARKNKPKQEAGTFQRWQQKFVNDMWQGDCSDGPWLPDPANPKVLKKTQLISFVDDASRVVPHAEFYFDTQLPSLLDCFRKALLKRGRPERTYCDNAWIYHSTTLRLLCAELNIKPSFCTVRRPPGKGKIERHIFTVQCGFNNVAEHAGIQTLEELNQFFFAWLSGKYHKTVHSELNGLSPMERWRIDQDRIERVSPAEVRRGLMLRSSRTVNRKTATVRVDNMHYQASVALAGEKVEVRFHFNDQSEVEIWQRGKFIEVAKPVVIGVNIDFSKHPKKSEDVAPRGTTYPAFKAYRMSLIEREKPDVSVFAQPNDLMTQQDLLDVFTESLGQRILSDGDREYLTNFFLKHSPLHKQAIRDRLKQIVEVAGNQLHMNRYCERLMDTVIQTRR
jgi:transposase InsO family protein